jgi:hypothetical protein
MQPNTEQPVTTDSNGEEYDDLELELEMEETIVEALDNGESRVISSTSSTIDAPMATTTTDDAASVVELLEQRIRLVLRRPVSESLATICNFINADPAEFYLVLVRDGSGMNFVCSRDPTERMLTIDWFCAFDSIRNSPYSLELSFRSKCRSRGHSNSNSQGRQRRYQTTKHLTDWLTG